MMHRIVRNSALAAVAAFSLAGCRKPLTFGELDARLGTDELCAALLRGSGSAAPVPGQDKAGPFSEVTPAAILGSLPKDQGAMEACTSGGFVLSGESISKDLYIKYPDAKYTVTLHYPASEQPKLKSFEVNAAAPAAAKSGPTGFMGNSGYLMELPAGYTANARMEKETELVYFFPEGTAPATDESKYGETGVVRLEVQPAKMEGKPLTLEIVKKGVSASLKQRKETFTVKDLDVGRPAFQVDITKPARLVQLFTRGETMLYVFTGGDEALVQSLARSVKEVGPQKQL